MTQRTRVLVAVGGLLILIVAFVLLQPGDDKKTTSDDATAPTVTSTAGTTPTGRTSTSTATPAPKPRPQVTLVRAVGLKPVGGIRSIEVDKGDTVRFTVTSDQPEDVHLHGYDVEKPVGPGKPARFVFKATIDGIFEAELEGAGVQLIKLQVNP